MTGKEASQPKQPSGFVSRALLAALIVAGLGFAAKLLGPQTIGEQIRRHLAKQLAEHYPDLEISIRRGIYEPSVGVILEDIRISQKRGSGRESRHSSTSMVRIERLSVVGSTQPELLLKKQSPLKTDRLVAEGVHINVWMNPDGSVPMSKLWPLPSFGPCAPRTEVRNLNLNLIPQDSRASALGMQLQSIVIDATPNSNGFIERKAAISGRSSFAKNIHVQVDAKETGFAISGQLSQSRFDSAVLKQIGSILGQRFEKVLGLECLFDTAFVAKKPTDGPLDYLARVRLIDGMLRHSGLPSTISDVRGLASIRPSGIELHSLNGALGSARWSMDGRTDALAWPCGVSLNMHAQGMLLDEELARVLPAKHQRIWDLFQPHGHIDVHNAKVTHNHGKWRVESATVDCKGVDAVVAKFPYPVQHLVGRVEVANGMATCERISGQVRGTRLVAGFRLPVQPEKTKERLIVVSTDGPVAIDNTLLAALTPRHKPLSKLESFARSLHPRGNVHLIKATFQTDATGTKSQDIDLTVSNGQLRYSKFAYPLYNVEGKIRVEDQLVKISGFRASNGNAGVVLCDGTYRMPTRDQADRLVQDSSMMLDFRAAKVPLDDALRSSLPTNAQRTWDSLSPSGIVDYLVVRIAQAGGSKPVQIRVAASEVESVQGNRDILSIQPRELPYRLDITDGNVIYDGNQVVIKSMHAVHDATKISASGNCFQNQQGDWQLVLDIHGGSRVSPDAQLVKALPDQMREAMRRLQLRRPVSVRGRTSLIMPNAKNPHPRVDWDVVMQLEGNRIGDVGPVRSLRGEIKSRGVSSELGVVAEGEVRIDSMHAYNLQVTSIQGPYNIQNDVLSLGTSCRVIGQPDAPLKAMQGRLFDGQIELNGKVMLSSSLFDIELSLTDGKIPSLLASLGHGRQELTGVFQVDMDLEGTVGTTDLLAGSGTASVSGANLYQLPLLVQVLNLLRITPTEDVAFTDSTVNFGIVDDQINFNDLRLWGDLVSLHGGGTLNRRQELDLTFNTRVSPKTNFSKLIRPLRADKYTLWDVDVRGPISSPEVELRRLDKMFPVNPIRRASYSE